MVIWELADGAETSANNISLKYINNKRLLQWQDSMAWWCIIYDSALGRERQEDEKFKVILGGISEFM